MDADKLLSLAVTLRETAADLVAQAERFELKAKIELAKDQPEIANIIELIIQNTLRSKK